MKLEEVIEEMQQPTSPYEHPKQPDLIAALLDISERLQTLEANMAALYDRKFMAGAKKAVERKLVVTTLDQIPCTGHPDGCPPPQDSPEVSQ